MIKEAPTKEEIFSAISESRNQGFSDSDIIKGLLNNGLTVDEAKRYLYLFINRPSRDQFGLHAKFQSAFLIGGAVLLYFLFRSKK